MFTLLLAAAVALPQIPDTSLTPGDVNPNVTVEMLCQKGGYTNKPGIRNVSEKAKQAVFDEYHIDRHSDKFEIDHDISLENGGSNDIKNLWPESYTTKPYNAHDKDALENREHSMMCKHEITLQQDQNDLRGDWTIAYRKYFPDHK